MALEMSREDRAQLVTGQRRLDGTYVLSYDPTQMKNKVMEKPKNMGDGNVITVDVFDPMIRAPLRDWLDGALSTQEYIAATRGLDEREIPRLDYQGRYGEST